MARIPLLNEEDSSVPARARELLQSAKARGRVFNIFRALANHPAALESFSALLNVVYGRGSSLSRRQAELAYTTATVVNQCFY